MLHSHTNTFTNNVIKVGDAIAANATHACLTLMQDSRYRVSHHTLESGEKLPPQSHFHCDKVLIAVSGSGALTQNDTTAPLFEGQLVQVPFGTLHTIQNTGKIPLKILEIRLGSYLEDDDQIAC